MPDFDVLIKFIADNEAALAAVAEIQQKFDQVGGGASAGGGGGKVFTNSLGEVVTPGDVDRIHQLAVNTKDVAQNTQQATEQVREFQKGTSETYPNAAKDMMQMANSGKTVTEVLKGQIQEARNMQGEYRRLQYAGRALQQIGTTFLVPSAAIQAGAALLAQNYVATAKEATTTTIAWKEATQSLKDSQNQVGSVLASIELPALQQMALIVKNLANFAEENPGIVRFGLEMTGVVVTLSTLAVLLGKGIQLYADVGFMTATANLILSEEANTIALNANTASNGGKVAGQAAILGGGAMGTLIPLIGAAVSAVAGVLLGNVIYDTIKKKNAPSAFTSEEQMFAGTMGVISGSIVGFLESVTKGVPMVDSLNKGIQAMTVFIGQLIGVVGKPSSLAIKGGLDKSSYQKTDDVLLNDYITYQKGLLAAQKTYDDAIKAEDASTKAQMDTLNQNFIDNNNKEWRDFTISETRAQQDYNNSRLKAAASFGDETLKDEQAHQLAMQRLLEDHNDTMLDLTANRDALGMIREMRSYEKSRSRAEQDYAISESQRHAAYAQQITDMEDNFAIQRQRAQEDFAQRQSDEEDAYRKQAKAIADADVAKKAELATELQNENDLVTKAFGDREAALGIIIDQAGRAAAYMLKYYNDQFNAYIAAFGGHPSSGGTSMVNRITPRDSGGYVNQGIFRNSSGSNEWVLSPSTTRYAESIVGGKLTQQNFMMAMLGAGSSRGNSTYNMSGLSAQDRLLIKDMINRTVDSRFKAEL